MVIRDNLPRLIRAIRNFHFFKLSLVIRAHRSQIFPGFLMSRDTIPAIPKLFSFLYTSIPRETPVVSFRFLSFRLLGAPVKLLKTARIMGMLMW